MAAWYTRRRETRGRAREREREDRREEGSQAQAGRVIIILQTTAAGTYLYNPSPSFAHSSPPRAHFYHRSFSHRSILPLPQPPPSVVLPASSSRRFAYTVHLSSPRAIRTNGRIRQLSRYTPPTPRTSFSLSIASPPPPPPSHPPSAILPPVALPRPSPSRSISVSAVFSMYTIP